MRPRRSMSSFDHLEREQKEEEVSTKPRKWQRPDNRQRSNLATTSMPDIVRHDGQESLRHVPIPVRHTCTSTPY
jgi:hypothetical protein